MRADKGQLPTLHRCFEQAAMKLGVSPVPDLFLYTDPIPNADSGAGLPDYRWRHVTG